MNSWQRRFHFRWYRFLSALGFLNKSNISRFQIFQNSLKLSCKPYYRPLSRFILSKIDCCSKLSLISFIVLVIEFFSDSKRVAWLSVFLFKPSSKTSALFALVFKMDISFLSSVNNLRRGSLLEIYWINPLKTPFFRQISPRKSK